MEVEGVEIELDSSEGPIVNQKAAVNLSVHHRVYLASPLRRDSFHP